MVFLIVISEDYRPKAVLPKHNLVVREDKNSEKNEPPPPRPTSAMSNDYQPPGPEAFRKLFYIFDVLVLHFVDYYLHCIIYMDFPPQPHKFVLKSTKLSGMRLS